MPNDLAKAGASATRQTRRVALWGARFWDGCVSVKGALRDCSSNLENRYYGARGDSLLAEEDQSLNVEITPKLTIARRYGNSVWNSNLWTNVNSFYDFRQFNADEEEIKTLIDTKTALYDSTNNSQITIWNKNPASQQSYMQSVGNNLFWGDGIDRKKWLTTLLSRVPYVFSNTSYNPYNFTPFALNSFIIDTNGDAEQLIGTVLQLSGFYILNGMIVFTLKNTLNGFSLPNSQQILYPGLELYFGPTSEVSSVLGQSGVTLTVQNLSGAVISALPGTGGLGGYTVGDILNINQTSPAGSAAGQVEVTSIGTSAGSGYSTATGLFTTTPGLGSGALINIVTSSGGLVSATIASGGIGYSVNEIVTPVQPGGMNGYFKVASVSGSSVATLSLVTGVPTGYSIVAGGTGYVTSSRVSATGGTGSGATISLVDDQSQFSTPFPYGGGPATGFVLNTPGTGYAVGDTLIPLEPLQPTANGAVLTVTEITGSIGGLTFVSGGSPIVPYTTGVPTWTTSGSGTGASFNITTVSGGQITGISVTGPGSNFSIGDLVYITQGSATGATLVVNSVTTHAVSGLTFVSGGPTISAYTAGVPTWTTSGAGTGATFNITAVTSGQVSGISVTGGGSGFAVNDLVNLTQGSATGAVLKVLTITGSAIATVGIVTGGLTPYTVASGVATTTSGAGTGATVNITTVASGAITSSGWSLSSGGSGYLVGDHISPSQGAASGASFTVTSVSSNGIASISISAGGATPYTTGTGIATNTSGSGTGATINITAVTSGAVTSLGWVLNSLGTGYQIGDKIYPSEGAATGAVFLVSSTGSATGPIGSFTVSENGTGYVSGTGLATSTFGSGTGATVNLIVGNELFFPFSTTSDTPDIFSGGNPISDSRSNAEVAWASVGGTTIDGSAVWFNRGPAVDNGLVYNWGIPGGTSAPTIVVNNPSSEWNADTYYSQWQFIVVTVSGSNYIQQVFSGGKSGASAPERWSTVPGQKTTDGTVSWICLSNDGDTTLSWTAETPYTPGHVLEETVSSVSCVFRLQPLSGINSVGTTPAYCWATGSQSGIDVGAAAQLPGHIAMAQNGGQSTSSATYSGTVNSFYLSAQGGSTPVKTFAEAGDGTINATGSVLFAGTQNLSIALLPTIYVPAAGTYTFTIGYQCSMFWGIGAGSLSIPISSVQVSGGALIITSSSNLDSVLTPGTSLTFSGLTSAVFLNSQAISVTSVSGKTFTADFAFANYGPIPETLGVASSGNTLAPSVVSGPMVWSSKYNYSTGTPIKGYPIMSANYSNDTGSGGFNSNIHTDSVQINFPSAGVYPVEIQHGVWYHSTGSYVTPTVSPALPSTTFSFYMFYTPPGGSTNYNIIPQSLACSNAASPTFPSWPTTLAALQALSPNYPSVVEASGNFTWWNLGPSVQFVWNASVNYTTSTFIVDTNSNEEAPAVPGVSGTAVPVFSTTLYGLTSDQNLSSSDGLIWVNLGLEGSSPSGTISTSQGGWSYVVSLVNTLDDTVSNASLASVSTGNFFSASGVFVSGGLPLVPDPQADYVAIFRTEDGGETYYLIPPPASGNGNTEYTLPLAQYLSEGFTDTTPDANLNTLLQAPVALQNSIPPKGAINLAFHLSRIFVSVGNTVYWSTGPDTPIGNGYNGFAPNNFAEFPSRVSRIIPLSAGTLVFTVSDIYILAGDGTVGNPITPEPYLQRLGLLSYNALTVNGSIVYFMTTDKQVVELNVHTGVSQIGQPIADILSLFSPSKSYLTWHNSGYQDQALFTADGSTGWYKMLTAIPPETGTPWCPKANIVDGVGAIQSCETSPGEIQLLLAPPPETTGPILFRDYDTYQDNGSNYPAFFTFGSVVLAHPGQLASIEFITADSHKFQGASPLTLGVLLGEISGNFETLSEFTNDPPQLPPSSTLWNQRFYLSQSKTPVECRHFQLRVMWPAQNFADQIESISPYGGFSAES